MSEWGIKFDKFQGMLEQLRTLEADIHSITEKALIETQAYIAKQADKYTEDKMLPADGEYRVKPSATKDTIIKNGKVNWEGDTASISAGFSIYSEEYDDIVLTPIFLMYGTPKMAPVPDLEDAVKGKTAKKAVAKIQKDIFINAIKEAEK